jgi:hypothetical protein
MKLALVFLLTAFNAFATDCFTREVELETNQVSSPKTICLNKIDLELDYFGNSKATVSMELDGQVVARTFSLNKGSLRPDGSRLYDVTLASQDSGFSCSEMWEVKTLASVVLSADVKTAVVENVKTELYYSWDHCHSDMRLKQAFFYKKI